MGQNIPITIPIEKVSMESPIAFAAPHIQKLIIKIPPFGIYYAIRRDFVIKLCSVFHFFKNVIPGHAVINKHNGEMIE